MRRLLSSIVLILVGHNAWALGFNPASPSTTGNYTVSWGTPTGCIINYPQYDCYDILESTDGGNTWGSPLPYPPTGSTSYVATNKPPGTYTYVLAYSSPYYQGWYPVESGTIVVNSPVVSFTINNASGNEGTTLTFTVTKSAVSAQTTGVTWTAFGGTAGASDFPNYATGTLSFAPNELSKTFTVNTYIDNLHEGNEWFNASLSSPTGPSALGNPSNGIGTIVDIDPQPTVSVSDATISEGGTLTFHITLSAPSGVVEGVNYQSVDSEAVAGTDYFAVNSGFGFAVGQTDQAVTVGTINDNAYEGTERMVLHLTYGGTPIARADGIGYITDEVDVPTFTISDASSNEGDPLAFSVTQHGASVFTHIVNWATADGTAHVSDGDFSTQSGALSFPPTSAATQSIPVNVVTIDEVPPKLEANETLFVNLSDGGLNGATITDSQGVGTLVNDDSVYFTISDATIGEGGQLQFTVTRNNGSDFTHAVNYSTADGTARINDNDYLAASGTLSFAPSTTSSSQTVYVQTVNDTKVENTETLVVNLTDGGQLNGATIFDNQGIGTITNDDSVSFTISDATPVSEGTSSGSTMSFTVSMSGATDLTHTVQWSTSNGTATAGTDYTAVGLTTVTFTNGQGPQTVNVSVTPDAVSEPNENLNANLSNASAWSTIARPQGVGTINNDDAPGTPLNLSGPIGVTGSTVGLTWSAASGYVTYHEVEQTLDTAVTVINTGSSAASYTVSGLSVDGVYKFRVRACSPAGAGVACSAWSNTSQTVRSAFDTTTGVPPVGTGSGDAGPSTGLTNDFNGIVSGSAAVAPSGAATYTIPIKIPPGTRGMQPPLAFVYSSHGDDGVVGRGWAVAGSTSAITRCPKTMAQDNAIHAVDYTSADRFCLDGQRLVLTSSTLGYGSDGATYRTELESFRNIVSNGGTQSSPNSFTVRTPDGNTLSYGGTAGSNFNASSPNQAEVAAWLLRHVEDKYGNFYDITYFEDEANGYFHTSQIAYTGHSQTPTSPSYATVDFVYEPRSNIVNRYRAGSVTSIQNRLKKLTIKNAGTAVREYVLAYDEGETAPPTGMTRLTSIKECAPADTGTCTTPTTFDWTNEVGGMGSTLFANLPQGYDEAIVDLNGDGRADIDRLPAQGSAQHGVSMGTSTGFQPSVTWTASTFGVGDQWAFADVDGDGKVDYVRFNTSTATHYVSRSNGTNFDTTANWTAHAVVSGSAFVDMNGDGRTDFVTWDNSGATDTITYYVSLSTGTGYTNQTWTGPKLSGAVWQPDSWDFHDVNGDGRTDLVLVQGTTHRIYVNNGAGFDPYFQATTEVPCATWADMNGDGLLDCVAVVDATTHKVSLWTGKSYVNQTWSASWVVGTPYLFLDMNGDGLADFIGGSDVAFSTGTGYVVVPAWSGFTGGGTYPKFGDFDGELPRLLLTPT